MYVPRLLNSTMTKAAAQFPAVIVTGPRQSGKTTFLQREYSSEAAYASLDDPFTREFALGDPQGFLDTFREKTAILDEIQYVPELFPYLKVRIDQQRQRYGKWLLTGSQQFQLMKNVTESLAGRIAILDLLPFSLLEFGQEGVDALESAIWNGGYPEPALAPEKRDLWVRSYIQTYIERDVRQMQNIRDLRSFELFLGLMAAFHSQMFNAAAIAGQCGVTIPTVKSWAGILEASWLIYHLSPWFRNYGKRLVKTPKSYFLDTALICSLTRQPDGPSALAGAMGGALFEGLIISETVKVFTLTGSRPDIYFWRSHDGLEVDLLIHCNGKLIPIEIKLTATPNMNHIMPLQQFKTLAGADAAETGILVCRVAQETPMPMNNIAMPWHKYPDWLMNTLQSPSVKA
jgi:predicted AAA+ superfamily ATPase